MSKKNKKNKTFQPTQKLQSFDGLSDALKNAIEEESLQKDILLEEDPIVPAVELTGTDKAKELEAEKTKDLGKYLNYLKEIARVYVELRQKAKKEKEAAEEAAKSVREEANSYATRVKEEAGIVKARIDKEKTEWSDVSSKFNEREKALVDRENALVEREIDLENGVYTGTVKRILNSLKESEEQIFADTEAMIQKLQESHGEYSKHEIELAEELANLKRERNELEREKKNWEFDKELEKEDIDEEYRRKYEAELRMNKDDNNRLAAQNQSLIERNEYLQHFMDQVISAFDGRDVSELPLLQNELKEDLRSAKSQLETRPTIDELEAERRRVSVLESENHKLRSELNDIECLRLKNHESKFGEMEVEIHGLTNQLENSHCREAALIDDNTRLRNTICQLTEEKGKAEKAFEAARRYDSNEDYQTGFTPKQEPNSLRELVAFLQSKMASSEKSFNYTKETISTFIAGLYMSPISILQGISGTGKTSLPRELAIALMSADKRYENSKAPYRICAIQSGWRDNMDLMGNYNSFEGKYNETDFFKALYTASLPKYRDTLFLIVLDEMNLSRPEHYFADFLSLLEQKESDRFITIHAPRETLPSGIQEDGRYFIPKNVRFIGTANHDETTMEFAPKTYDRSNVMEMPRNQPQNILKTNDSMCLSYTWLEEQFALAFANHKADFSKFDIFIKNSKVKELFESMNIGIGNRFEDQALRFITAYISCTDKPRSISLAEAADTLLTSRLLRTLQNKYELTKDNIETFKNNYENLFFEHFGGFPEIGLNMLEKEKNSKPA